MFGCTELTADLLDGPPDLLLLVVKVVKVVVVVAAGWSGQEKCCKSQHKLVKWSDVKQFVVKENKSIQFQVNGKTFHFYFIRYIFLFRFLLLSWRLIFISKLQM